MNARAENVFFFFSHEIEHRTETGRTFKSERRAKLDREKDTYPKTVRGEVAPRVLSARHRECSTVPDGHYSPSRDRLRPACLQSGERRFNPSSGADD